MGGSQLEKVKLFWKPIAGPSAFEEEEISRFRLKTYYDKISLGEKIFKIFDRVFLEGPIGYVRKLLRRSGVDSSSGAFRAPDLRWRFWKTSAEAFDSQISKSEAAGRALGRLGSTSKGQQARSRIHHIRKASKERGPNVALPEHGLHHGEMLRIFVSLEERFTGEEFDKNTTNQPHVARIRPRHVYGSKMRCLVDTEPREVPPQKSHCQGRLIESLMIVTLSSTC
ncbi:hypothetical protein CROQUDRAFT_93005 [Cronartium quercuum f. sp. fusiforme G11]|uniref:Uncharacterized protein n=1 Tax=Cronartium quercuum f. sp. fusiforme G11 TaxID=708437 RepID=A0A9P6NMC1_9BASI|nr:hypothetical protein CROQUDRAFT_93005 [Cronartium quercuum f. sp. fusiforme G11]